MRRALLIAVAGVGAVALAVPAQAGFGPMELDNEYEGRAERDPFTYVGFNVTNQKVAKVTAQVHYTCDDGDGGRARARVKGKLPINDGRFAGTLRRTADFVTRAIAPRGGNPGHIKYRFRGKLLKRGKAKGELDAEIRFRPTMMRGGGEQVRCYSGKLDWKAKRGANIDVPKEL